MPRPLTAAAAPGPTSRTETERRFLDAAERLLVHEGSTGITTRRLAEEAGANHGLVHYYFGSMEELFLQVLERFTERLATRQRTMYEADLPFLERWRTAMRFLDEDRTYQKIWFELQAIAWNRREFRDRVARVHVTWRAAMREAVRQELSRRRLEGPLSVEAWVTLIVTMNEGIILERLSGVSQGHAELLGGIDRWLTSLQQDAEGSTAAKKKRLAKRTTKAKTARKR